MINCKAYERNLTHWERKIPTEQGIESRIIAVVLTTETSSSTTGHIRAFSIHCIELNTIY